MNDRDRALLVELRRLLLHLHKTLIDWQRDDYERVNGRLQTTQLLKVMFNDPAFAWLRTMSGLIVRIDEALDEKPPDVSGDGTAGRAGARAGRAGGRHPRTRCVITPRCRSCRMRCSRTATSSRC